MLNDTRVRTAKASDRPLKLSDGGDLYLLLKPNGSKLWRLAYRFGGKQRSLALGAYPTTTLKQARERATRPRSCWLIILTLRFSAGSRNKMQAAVIHLRRSPATSWRSWSGKVLPG